MENKQQIKTAQQSDECEPQSTREIIVDSAVSGFIIGIASTAFIYFCIMSCKNCEGDTLIESARGGLAIGVGAAANIASYCLIMAD